ncbi:MAG: tRNA-dihydrouridine synthase family protein, partial [Desulfamplus sp.]|nr:tRNA-dihydrouridine synthase family protein [Desulfamplus sp.]
ISTVFKWRDEELPWLVCQIFGSDPKSMALAAKRVEKEGVFGVDLNFGCCAAAICKKGSGAALLKNPKLARQIVEAVRQSVSIPVFVKFRIGWEDNPVDAAFDAEQMAFMFEEAGADALVFHPRTAPDRRLRPPKWEYIKKVKEAVSIPVFGNGNVFDPSDCEEMLSMSGCDGISIGRMAVARPWIFAALACGSMNVARPDPAMFSCYNSSFCDDGRSRDNSGSGFGFLPEGNIYRHTAMRMMTLLVRHHDERTAVKMFKKFIPYYAAGFKFGHSISKQMLKPDTPDGIFKAIDGLFPSNGEPPESVDRPNLHLFL